MRYLRGMEVSNLQKLDSLPNLIQILRNKMNISLQILFFCITYQTRTNSNSRDAWLPNKKEESFTTKFVDLLLNGTTSVFITDQPWSLVTTFVSVGDSYSSYYTYLWHFGTCRATYVSVPLLWHVEVQFVVFVGDLNLIHPCAQQQLYLKHERN
jgi:hypothetical protein